MYTHFRSVRSACLGCAMPVHLVREESSGEYEWQHDEMPTMEQVRRHRARGVGRQRVSHERAEGLLARMDDPGRGEAGGDAA